MAEPCAPGQVPRSRFAVVAFDSSPGFSPGEYTFLRFRELDAYLLAHPTATLLLRRGSARIALEKVGEHETSANFAVEKSAGEVQHIRVRWSGDDFESWSRETATAREVTSRSFRFWGGEDRLYRNTAGLCSLRTRDEAHDSLVESAQVMTTPSKRGRP